MRMRATPITALAPLLGVLLTGSPPTAAASADSAWSDAAGHARLEARLREWFADIPDRYPGSPGNLAMQARVAERFAASGFEHGVVTYQAPCFQPGETHLRLPDGDTLRLLPMHPAFARPGNLHARTLTVDAVYIPPADSDTDAARSQSIAPPSGQDLRDTLIVQEFSGDWQSFATLGLPVGYVFIGADEHPRHQTMNKMFSRELRLPRFYLPPESGERLRAALRDAGGRLTLDIQAEPSRWVPRTLGNPWVFIPGADPALEREVVLITAPLDANALVPERAEGGVNGANLFVFLEWLDAFRQSPPARSVMLVAVNARSQANLGDRLLAWNLLAPLPRVEALRDILARDLREQEMLAGYYRQLRLDDAHLEQDDALLRRLRTLTDQAGGGLPVSIKGPLVNAIKKDVNRLRAQQVDLARQDSGLDAATQALRHAELEARRQLHVRVLTLFNKFGIQTTLKELHAETPEAIAILRDYVTDIAATQERWAALNRAELAVSESNASCRAALGGRRVVMALSLEFDWNTPSFGFASGSDWGDGAGWQNRFGHNALTVAQALPGVTAGRRPLRLLDTMTRAGGLPEGYYFPGFGAAGALSAYHNAEATPAFALRNVFAMYPRSFTLDDTFDRLNFAHVAEIQAFLEAYLPALLADPTVTLPAELPPFNRSIRRASMLWSGKVGTFEFDEFAADVVPTLPVPHSMVILRDLLTQPGIDAQGTVPVHIGLTDERAVTTVYGFPWDGGKRTILCDAFKYDADAVTVIYAVDAGDVHERVKSEIVRDTDMEKTLALFPCREFPVFDRVDSSLLSAFPLVPQEYMILSATRNAAPRRYGFYGAISLTSSKKEAFYFPTGEAFGVYVEAGERVKLVTKKKRVVLNATADEPTGEGYLEAREMGPGFFDAAARDLAVLNAYRLGRLQGVSDELAHEFMARGKTALADMQAAWARHDYGDYWRHRVLALGAQVKTYTQTSTITNDMLKAVVFYMALMLPFSFFLQRLLFKTVKIEAQMGGFVAIFILTFIVFRLIHPAFRISQSPEAMFVAFVMGGLALFVIGVLRGRFEGEMQLLFQTYTGMDTSQVAYSTAGQQAMMIGVQNMKRRRVRTILTTTTIVLVTFTMLAFSSISKKLSPTVIPVARTAPYTGLFYHWPGQLMDGHTAGVLGAIFADRAEILPRLWALSPRKMEGEKLIRRPWPVAAPALGTAAQVDGVLGLRTLEDGFLRPFPLRPGGRFFAADDAREVILTAAMADQLGITAGGLDRTHIRFAGVDMAVVGILDDAEFAAMRDLDGKSLTPIQVRSKLRGQEETTATVDILDVQSDAGTEYVSLSMLLIMPARTLQSLAGVGAATYSLSIRFPPDAPLWTHVENLLTATDARFYVASTTPFAAGGEEARQLDPGVYFMGSGYRTSIGGLSVLIIPLLIAGTIILNTMLGSVYERKSEIAIYNAVGLNPNHIGMFFLAEAFVYSVIGSVGGYLIGQVLSLGLSRLDLVRGINLNFSSLNVVYVILFTVTVVLLSTLYPAHVATKAAVPSGKRKWSIPPNDGQTMEIAFPFIYRPELVAGILQYVDQYLGRFSEATLGDLLATRESRTRTRDAQDRPVYTLQYHLALAPYDLGVTQRVVFTARYDETVRSYRIFMGIHRLSGQDTNWVWTNRPFLERLRQHLMRWRNLTALERQDYTREGLLALEAPETTAERPPLAAPLGAPC